MKFSSFTFILTDACNWSCGYCYQKKGRAFLSEATVERACAFFYPLWAEGCFVHFYGGEPLLAWPLIRRTVAVLEKLNRGESKHLHFTLTTNGSLITPEVSKFLSHYRFRVLLSFDGLAQGLGRKKGSQRLLTGLLKRLLRADSLTLFTNSVFTPSTVKYLARSLMFLCRAGVPDVQFCPSIHQPWKGKSRLAFGRELARLRAFLVKHYRRTGTIPVQEFRRPAQNGRFSCSAGRAQMALAPDGKLWGCYLFPDYFRGKEGTPEYHDYCFGDFEEFRRRPQKVYGRVLAAYSRLKAESFFTPRRLCALCNQIEECAVCPAGQAIFSGILGLITSAQCQLNRILFRERKRFWKEIDYPLFASSTSGRPASAFFQMSRNLR